MAGPEPVNRDIPRGVIDALTAGVIVTDAEFVVHWFSRMAVEFFPEVRTEVSMYELLGPFAHEQKIDRLLLRRERILIEFDDGRQLEWLRGTRQTPDGGHVLLAWPVALTDELTARRASFTMAAFHELRTPLTALLGFAEVLEMEPDGLSPTQLEAAAMIGLTARHLAELTNDIFDLAQNSFGELRLNLQPVDFAPLVREVIEIHRSEAAGKCHRVLIDLESDLPLIQADPGRIRQVVHNVISNACGHNPPGTLVEIGLRESDGGIMLEIRDHGEGVGFDNPDDAFRTFRRGRNLPDGDREGSGIGLSLAKRLTELHRGRIELESRPGEGTRVTILLPINRDEALELGEAGPA